MKERWFPCPDRIDSRIQQIQTNEKKVSCKLRCYWPVKFSWPSPTRAAAWDKSRACTEQDDDGARHVTDSRYLWINLLQVGRNTGGVWYNTSCTRNQPTVRTQSHGCDVTEGRRHRHHICHHHSPADHPALPRTHAQWSCGVFCTRSAGVWLPQLLCRRIIIVS